MPVTEAQVRQALTSVVDPDLHRDIVSLGFVKAVEIAGGKVNVRIELTTPAFSWSFTGQAGVVSSMRR